jgi:hypothetical protein
MEMFYGLLFSNLACRFKARAENSVYLVIIHPEILHLLRTPKPRFTRLENDRRQIAVKPTKTIQFVNNVTIGG